MADVSQDLFVTVKDAYQNWLDTDPTINAMYKRIRDGTVSFEEAHKFAERSGQFLARAFGLITPDMLPDGKMYYNIAMDVVMPACELNHKVVSEMAYEVMKVTNKEAGVPLGAKIADFGRENVENIINKITAYDTFEEGRWLLDEPMINSSIKIVDDTIAKNAEFQLSAGIEAVIERVAVGGCCDWCNSIAGVYDYADVKDKGNDVFRRHNYCRCMVLYRTGKRISNAHSKVEYADHTSAMRAWQKDLSSRVSLTPKERLAAAEQRRQRR